MKCSAEALEHRQNDHSQHTHTLNGAIKRKAKTHTHTHEINACDYILHRFAVITGSKQTLICAYVHRLSLWQHATPNRAGLEQELIDAT